MNETLKSFSTTRRDLLGAAAAVFTIVKPHQVRGAQANSAVTVGLIGCGRRGVAISGWFAKNENARMAAVCDIYDDQIATATSKFSGAKTFKDLNALLASDVDAVYIATPPYLHPEHFEAAVKARKHIFMEKPAGVDPAGCRRVLAAAKSADPKKRITIDYQQRYGREYNAAYQIVKSGQLGPIKMIRAAWLGGNLPHRQGHPEAEEKMRNWLFYREFSGDIIVEQNCHNLDVVNWFMGKHPIKASGVGGRAMRKEGNILDNLAATFQFDDGTVFSYSASQFSTARYNDISETFICENGSINTSRKGYTVWSPSSPTPTIVKTDYDITKDAVDRFIDGVRNGAYDNAGPSAVESTLTAIMAREAIYSGKQLTFDQVANAKPGRGVPSSGAA